MQREHVKLPESETENPVFKTDDFRMYCFKVRVARLLQHQGRGGAGLPPFTS